MRSIEELKQTPHLCITAKIMDGIYEGWVEWSGFRGTVIFGYNEAGLMEHVSISSYKRRQLPRWEDMCRLKDMFFYPNEMVVQIHPSEERYVHSVGIGPNKLENVLHLWRPMNGDFSILNRPEEWD